MIINLTAIRPSLTKLQLCTLLYTFMYNIIPVAMIALLQSLKKKNSKLSALTAQFSCYNRNMAVEGKRLFFHDYKSIVVQNKKKLK